MRMNSERVLARFAADISFPGRLHMSMVYFQYAHAEVSQGPKRGKEFNFQPEGAGPREIGT
jgi:hypothetical protein